MHTAMSIAPRRIVVAVGGHAIKQAADENGDLQALDNIGHALALSIEEGNELIITFGNGPQVGELNLMQIDRRDDQRGAPEPSAPTAETPVGLAWSCAASQGSIAYQLEQAIDHHLNGDSSLASLLTRVEVDRADPAFSDPAKSIGPPLSEAQRDALANQYQWRFRREENAGDVAFRRVVPSPRPLQVLELPVIERLVRDQTAVICGGGGGIAVARDNGRQFNAVDAIVDKDYTASLLAQALNADLLVLATDIDGVYRDMDSERPQRFDFTTPDELRDYPFPAGSMAPKVEAACDFVNAGDCKAVIGASGDLTALLNADAGTVIMPRAVGTH